MFTIPNGVYKARSTSCKITETSDGVKFVEANLEIDLDLYNPERKEYIHWRSPLTKGGIKKTFLSLVKMGASMDTNDEIEVTDPLKGVGSKPFMVEIVNIECDDNEAPGKYKSFAKVVL
jgi:hypothetical protein